MSVSHIIHMHFIHVEDKKRYDEAMKRGYVESALPLVLFVGVTGSGKTLFKRLLLGQSVPEFSPSTPLAEPAVRTMSICQVQVGEVSWKSVGPEEMMDKVAEAIKGKVSFESPREDSSKKDSKRTSSSTSEQEKSKPEQKNTQSEKHMNNDMSVTTVQPQDDVPQQSTTHTSNTTIDDALRDIQIDSSLFEKMKATSTSTNEKLMDMDFLYLLDSGGQPAFREMLPHFVQKAAATVLMMKLNERLDFKPTIRYREEGGKVDDGYLSQLTNEEILHQYIRAVQAYASKVFVVGTHMDRESECQSETREMKNEKLLKAFRPVISKQLELYEMGNPDQLIFPVDCTSREKDAENVTQEFRKRMIKMCMGEKVKIPLPWFVLDQLLMLLSTKMKVKVLSLDECYQAAENKLHMPHNMCNSALKHLGDKNIIFYCPNILPKVVFSNAQVLLDKITELVRCHHALRTNNSTNAVPSCMESSERWLFRDYAQVNPKLLEKAFPSDYREDLFNATNFLELLEGLLIAARLDDGNHFIPSLLPDLPNEKVPEHRVTSSDHPAPLVIHYPNMWLPVGVMPSLVVYLRNGRKWKISSKYGKPSCLYHNCIKFKLPGGRPGSVVLIDSTKFLEIHIKSALDPLLCRAIREDIMAGLEEAHKSLHYDPPEAEIGFLCSGMCGNTDEPHLATLDDKKETWRCSEDDSKGGTFMPRESVWLKEFEDTNKGLFMREVIYFLCVTSSVDMTPAWVKCLTNM